MPPHGSSTGMKFMTERFFADTNILVYSFLSDGEKWKIADNCIQKESVISTQVLIEYSNVLLNKLSVAPDKVLLIQHQI